MSELIVEGGSRLAAHFIVATDNESADSHLVEFIAHEMTNKLRVMRLDGRRGWYTAGCSNKQLHEYLKEHLAKTEVDPEQMIDVINLAAMIFARTKMFGKTA